MSVLPSYADVVAAADRIAPYIRRTPMMQHPALDAAVGATVLIKPEPLQRTGSFKLRGATNAALRLPEAARAGGIVTHSSGNHGQAVACAAAALGMPATVAMPSDAPGLKVRATKRWGAEVVPFDRHGVDRDDLARGLAAERGATVIPPFDHPDVIAGQGTLVLELLEDAAAEGLTLDTLAVCTGGGGLLGGCSLVMAERLPGAKVWAVEPEGWDDYGQSLRAGSRIANDGKGPGLCDALLSKQPGEMTFAVNQPRVEGGVFVTQDEVFAAMRFAFEHLKIVVEPGGSVALAAVLAGKVKGEVIGVVVSGGNADPAIFAQALAAG
ncbi:threonine/serine dehydratase [Rhodovarius crocodyli]|uniref:Threonine/serine dehydratase n=1 Tax=Rhodovarius crocodyli TaxID=1979269 RepID=A0A437MN48_9PROT|nr:threonine/serine dehydratase [Rhodovarius crocodyli]RVT99040.1 threonine/serine dehydratase [Rhodovarius crocodyli]